MHVHKHGRTLSSALASALCCLPYFLQLPFSRLLPLCTTQLHACLPLTVPLHQTPIIFNVKKKLARIWNLMKNIRLNATLQMQKAEGEFERGWCQFSFWGIFILLSWSSNLRKFEKQNKTEFQSLPVKGIKELLLFLLLLVTLIRRTA